MMNPSKFRCTLENMRNFWLLILKLTGMLPFEGKTYTPKKRSIGHKVRHADEYWNNRWSC